MVELRLILLGVGALVIVAIWVWGSVSRARAERAARRAEAEAAAASAGYTDAEAVDTDAFGPALEADAPFDPDLEHADTVVLAPLSAADERRPQIDPPIITLDDLPDDITRVELSPMPTRSPEVPVVEPVRTKPPVLKPLNKILGSPTVCGMRPTPPPARPATPSPPPQAAVRPTPVAPPAADEPLEGAAPSAPTKVERPVRPVGRPVAAPAPTPQVAPGRPASPAQALPPANDPPPDRRQRIVSVRLVMLSGRLATGEQLAQAFRAEQLAYGRYKIFHRMDDHEQPLFSVASLVEPGSFDPDTMATERYLGVSMFAVFPGPRPAPEVFDELVATGRRLAARLGAALQDDTGQSLVGQRLVAVREDLVRFESVATAARTGRRPD